MTQDRSSGRSTGGQGTARAQIGADSREFISNGEEDSIGTANDLEAQAYEYGQKVAEAAAQAKDYVSDKIKDLENVVLNIATNNAKAYVRQHPGLGILISAGGGLVLGLLFRGSRR